MDGLFNLAKTLFGIEIEPADGLAPVIKCECSLFLVLVTTILNFLTQIFLFRFGIKMLDSSKLKILWEDLLHTSTLIHIVVLLKKDKVHGWMRLFLVAVYYHVMVPVQGCLLPTWCAIKHHQ